MSKRTLLLRSMKREREYNRSFEAGGEKLDMCIDALEKQVAKKPETWADGTEHCPCCEHDLAYISSEDEYCSRCGQKLDYRLE